MDVIYCLRFALLLVSAIAYIHYFRCRLNLKYGYAAIFTVSLLMLIMLAAGLCRVMYPVAWLIAVWGLCLSVLKNNPLSRSALSLLKFDGASSIRSAVSNYISWTILTPDQVIRRWKKYASRAEYALFFAVILGMIIYQYQFYHQDAMGTTDIWAAWLQQFAYMVQNGRWSDAGYQNYASAYAMLGNGLCYYIGVISGQPGLYSLNTGYFIIAFSALLTLTNYVNFRKLSPFFCVGIVAFYIYWLFFSPQRYEHSLKYAFLLLLLVYFIFNRQAWRDILVFIGAMFMTVLLIQMPMTAFTWFYPIDSGYCCLAAGCAAALLSFSRVRFDVLHIWTFAPILFAVTLLKPTGVMPAIFIGGMFLVYALIKLIRSRKKFSKSHFIWLLISITAVAATGLSTYGMWNGYVKIAQLKYQHRMQPQWQTQMFGHIKNGIPEKNQQELAKKIKYASVIHKLFHKPDYFKHIENRLNLWGEKIFGDLDQSFAYLKTFPQKTHLFTIMSLAVLAVLWSIVLTSGYRGIYTLLLGGGILLLAFTVICQYYIGPMFFDVPGLLRYIWPVAAIMLAIACICICGNIKNSHWTAALITAVLSWGISFHFSTPYHIHKSPEYDQRLAYGVWKLANNRYYKKQMAFSVNEDLACSSILGRIFLKYIWAKDFGNVSDNYARHCTMDTPIFFTVDGHNAFLGAVSYLNSKLPRERGVYIFSHRSISKGIDFVKVNINEDGIRLLAETFAIKDISKYDFDRARSIEIGPEFYSFDASGKRIPSCTGISVDKRKNKTHMTELNKHYAFFDDEITVTGRIKGDKKIKCRALILTKRPNGSVNRMPEAPELSIKYEGDRFTATTRLSQLPPPRRGEYYSIQFEIPAGQTTAIDDIKITQKISAVTDPLILETAVKDLQDRISAR